MMTTTPTILKCFAIRQTITICSCCLSERPLAAEFKEISNEKKKDVTRPYNSKSNKETCQYLISSAEITHIEGSACQKLIASDSDCRVFLVNSSMLHVAARDLGIEPS